MLGRVYLRRHGARARWETAWKPSGCGCGVSCLTGQTLFAHLVVKVCDCGAVFHPLQLVMVTLVVVIAIAPLLTPALSLLQRLCAMGAVVQRGSAARLYPAQARSNTAAIP